MAGAALVVPALEVRDFCSRVLEANGARRDVAEAVAEDLVKAELWGIESHGLTRLAIYQERLARGSVNGSPDIRKIVEAGATAVVDGDNGPGAAVGGFCMRLAVDLAKASGIGLVLARGSNHYGVAGVYTLHAIANDCIGMTGTNAPSTMAAWGGKQKVLGTNPFAVGVPRDRGCRILLDMSASVVAKGKILPYLRRSESIPAGWALDATGRPTTDAVEAWNGLVLPFAGPKGSGFAIVMDILAGVLSGASYGPLIRDQYEEFEAPQGVGHFFIAINIANLMPVQDFFVRLDDFVSILKGSAPAPGFHEIILPGEFESRHEEVRGLDGIPIEPTLVKVLRETASRSDVPVPDWLVGT